MPQTVSRRLVNLVINKICGLIMYTGSEILGTDLRAYMFPLVTEISPIFGLSLLGLIDVGIIVGAVVGLVGSVVIASVILYSNRSLLEQQKKASSALLGQQEKVNSAELTLKLLEKWDGPGTFTEMLYKLETPNAKFTDEKDGVHFVLGIFEGIAILRNDKTLTENHVREFFGTDIVRIDANESVMKILNEYHHEDIEHNYSNLKAMLDDSKKWGMKPYSSEESSLDSS